MKRFRREATKPKPIGNLIRCHDCKAFGYVALSGGEVILPDGWRLAWVGLKPLYICGACAEKRRAEYGIKQRIATPHGPQAACRAQPPKAALSAALWRTGSQ